MANISQKELKKYLEYNPLTGDFKWKTTGRGKRKNKKAGTLNTDGYIRIMINYKYYPASNLAWLYMTGEWPKETIDHKNRIRNDDKWKNLRPASRKDQQGNKKLNKNNTSKYRGVCWDKPKNSWLARIYKQYKQITLGHFNTKEEAKLVYDKAAKEYFGEFYKK